jgi:hypothetical protein
MADYQKNIHYLKKAIFDKLNTDVTLQNLLGGAGKISHRNPPKEVSYPCLVYFILDDKDHPFDETQISGKATRANFRVDIYSKESTSEQSDNIEARVKELLQGQRTLDTTEVICYSCIRDSLVEPMENPDLQVWVTPSRYRVTWATKAQS